MISGWPRPTTPRLSVSRQAITRLCQRQRSRPAGLTWPLREFFNGAPDLAVEVLSPSNTPTEVTARLNDYFESGTRLAWLIHPEPQFVEVCQSPIERTIVGSGGQLDGGEVVSGFQYEIEALFRPWDWD